ncbi:NADH dehydrogenase [ubiquinone] 1 alpha subcomplex assembly factor 4-like [Montipora foliosa]|uniref:NADH dehydrogenase [ubiquinone] 1 alpha subcomplex assembly factor 4-like n=1 Tax=Montipora foliosa TaxID=591990 RepID=UPI0035F1CBAB
MGARVTRLTRLVKRPLESRWKVDRMLEKKPIPAPRHPSSQNAMDEERKRNKSLFQQQNQKDDNFLGKLKDFKIDSLEPQGSVPATTSSNSARKLPDSREPRLPRLIGEAPKGKITPLGLSELFAKRLSDPDKWTEEKLAEHYQIDKEALSSVLKHFSDFAVVKKKDYPRPQDDMSFIE